MSTRNLLIIAISIISLQLLLSGIVWFLPTMFSMYTFSSEDEIWVQVAYMLSGLLIPLLFFMNPAKIADLLKVKEGDWIDLKDLQAIQLLRISLLVMGIYLVITSLIPLVDELMNLFKAKVNNEFLTLTGQHDWQAQALRMIIGALLIIKVQVLSKWLLRHTDIDEPLPRESDPSSELMNDR